MNEQKSKFDGEPPAAFGLPEKLGPYQVVVWNLANDPPTARLVNLPDPRDGFMAAFNSAHTKQQAVATSSLTPPE